MTPRPAAATASRRRRSRRPRPGRQLTVTRAATANLGPATLDVAISDGEKDPRRHRAAAEADVKRGEVEDDRIPIGLDFQGEEPRASRWGSRTRSTTRCLPTRRRSPVTIPRSGPTTASRWRCDKVRNGSADLPVTVPGLARSPWSTPYEALLKTDEDVRRDSGTGRHAEACKAREAKAQARQEGGAHRSRHLHARRRLGQRRRNAGHTQEEEGPLMLLKNAPLRARLDALRAGRSRGGRRRRHRQQRGGPIRSTTPRNVGA